MLMAGIISRTAVAQDDKTIALTSTLAEFSTASFQQKPEIIDRLSKLGDERVLNVFQAMLGGELFVNQDSQTFLAVKSVGDTHVAVNVMTGAALGAVDTSTFTKLSINNALRTKLRGEIAQLSLSSSNVTTRLNAVRETIKSLSPESTPLLRAMRERERDGAVREALDTALALLDIKSNDKLRRLAAIHELGGSGYQESRSALAQLLEKNANAEFVEADNDVRDGATRAIARIDSSKQLYGFAETAFFGLSLGSVLLLAAIGLAITFGVMGVINMAHGELMMLGAYTTYVVQTLMPNHIDLSLWVAVPAAFVVAGTVGIVIERSVIRFLYGRPLETLLATFGISLVLQQLVRTIFSPLNRSVETPSWMQGAWEINSSLSLTFNRLYIIIFSLLIFFALLLVLKKTRFGLQMRAVSQNREMSQAMGIRTTWIDALTFGLGSGIAGIAGVALSQLTNVGPNLGQSYIIDSFMVVVFGGVGNLWGMLVGALSLGVLEKVLEPWAGAVLAKIILLVGIILFIQKRPRGLFPKKGRAAEA